MPIDPADSDAVGLGPAERVRAGSLTAFAASDAGGGGGANANYGPVELAERLRGLGAERLAEIVLRLIESRGDEVKALVDEALRETRGDENMSLQAAPPHIARMVRLARVRSGPLVDEARLREALDHNAQSVTRVARALGISRMTVYRSMRRYGMASRSLRRGGGTQRGGPERSP